MNPEEIKAKFENIEDPEVKKIIDELNEWMMPKFKELQERLATEKPGMMKMFKIAKEFSENLKTDYKDKFGRELDEDMKKTNEYLGFNQSDMLGMLQNLK